ncbi:MAG: phage major capsid protein [Brockia lithotrophica]|nr:phage major capsid protein [Brockia lithotrophica]
MKKYVVNFASPIRIEVFREAGFLRGTTVYRAHTIFDGAPVDPTAFALLIPA